MKPFHVVTVVWGPEFRRVFLDVCVPNQLTPGNLGALPAGSRYRVFTSEDDVDVLEAGLREVSGQMAVDLIAAPELSASDGTRFTRMTACHAQALRDAAEAGAALIFLSPDIVLSEGTLAAVVRRHDEGKRAVACTGLRVQREAFVEALRARGGTRGVPPRELVSLALAHLHPFTLAHMADGVPGSRRPIGVYWNVPGEGILARPFYMHPLMVDPPRRDARPDGTIDQHYLVHACPARDQIHVVTDSDELAVFEMSHVDAAVTETGPEPISRWRAATVLCRCDAHQKTYWRVPIRLHVREVDVSWKAIEAASARFARHVGWLRFPALWVYVTSRRVRPWTRPVGKLRKKTARASRRVRRRARAAL